MSRPKDTRVWPPIPSDDLWEWYWGELLTPGEIAARWGGLVTPLRPGTTRSAPTPRWVSDQLVANRIPQRSPSDRARLWQANKSVNPRRYKLVKSADGGDRYEHRRVYEDYYGVTLGRGDEVDHLDHVSLNNHPLNLALTTKADHARKHVALRTGWNQGSRPARIPMFEVYMRMAENVAARSHHPTTRVGCVVTSFDLRRVLAVGYNGNASGLDDATDSDAPGESQTVHAEENALLYAGEHGTNRVIFVTESPCLMCVKLIVNAGVRYLYYRREYRQPHPLKVARYLGVKVYKYDRWANESWPTIDQRGSKSAPADRSSN